MKVKKRTLLLIACLVWGIAGFNILRIGLLAYRPYISVLNVILSLLVFAIFQTFIFGRLVKNIRKESSITKMKSNTFSTSSTGNHS